MFNVLLEYFVGLKLFIVMSGIIVVMIFVMFDIIIISMVCFLI